MFGFHSVMKMLLCFLDEKYVIKSFALELSKSEQLECLIVIKMSRQFKYYKHMTKLREVINNPVLNYCY